MLLQRLYLILGRVPNCNIATQADENAQPKCCTNLDITAAVVAAQATNKSNCIIKESDDPGRCVTPKTQLSEDLFTSKIICRYLCAFSYYQSLLINNRCSVFIHVPVPSDELSPTDVVTVLASIIAHLIKQL